jgi:hypothetical protein
MVQVTNERAWNFLEKSATIAIVSNIIALPDDFGTEQYIKVGEIILTPRNIINDVDAFYAHLEDAGELIGYFVNETGIELHASATGTAILGYTARVQTYTDDVIDTVFPLEFLPLFERAVLTAWYEFDVDADRLPSSFQIDAVLLKKLKELDNKRKAAYQMNPHGYTKGRG